MSMKKTALISLISALGIMICGVTHAQLGRAPQKTAESYSLTSQNGPWMVMATVFADYDEKVAYDKALKLVQELRQNRMNAYIYAKKQESDTTEARPHWVYDKNDLSKPPTISTTYKYLNKSAKWEFAVLVGDFKNITDDAAEKMLKKVRLMNPRCLGGQPTHPLFSMTESRQNSGLPLAKAFLVTNPMIQKSPNAASQLDKVVLEANKNIKRFSLLDCPKQYSVQVAVLKGVTTLNQQQIMRMQRGDAVDIKTKQTLEEADEKAVRMCELLRAKGVEAYVFRDHYASIVTIGSFDRIGEMRDGEMVLDPAIMKIFKEYSATCDPRGGVLGIKQKTIYDPKLKVNIPYDITPKIIVAPRRPMINGGGGLFATR